MNISKKCMAASPIKLKGRKKFPAGDENKIYISVVEYDETDIQKTDSPFPVGISYSVSRYYTPGCRTVYDYFYITKHVVPFGSIPMYLYGQELITDTVDINKIKCFF